MGYVIKIVAIESPMLLVIANGHPRLLLQISQHGLQPLPPLFRQLYPLPVTGHQYDLHSLREDFGDRNSIKKFGDKLVIEGQVFNVTTLYPIC